MRYESPYRNRVGQDMRDKPIRCETCSMSFVSERGLKIHQSGFFHRDMTLWKKTGDLKYLK